MDDEEASKNKDVQFGYDEGVIEVVDEPIRKTDGPNVNRFQQNQRPQKPIMSDALKKALEGSK